MHSEDPAFAALGNLLRVVALAGLVLFLLSYGRGVKVGLGLGVLCVVALNLRQVRSVQLSARLYRLLAVAVIVLILVVAALGLGFTDIGHLSRFQEVSLASDHGSVYWRLIWWERLMDELFVRNPLFGLGFGENLGAFNPYIDAGDASGWPIRAPHNVNVTVLSRMGFVGFAIWLAILLRGIGGLFLCIWRSGVGTGARVSLRSASRLRAARREEISFWLLMLLTTWGNGSFGVLMEGPVLGVWFWFALGFSSGRSLVLREAPGAARSGRRPHALPRLEPAEVIVS